jgi:hypothetical protein
MQLYHVTVETPNGTEGRLMMLPEPPLPPRSCVCGKCGMQCYHLGGRSRCCDAPTTRETLDAMMGMECR